MTASAPCTPDQSLQMNGLNVIFVAVISEKKTCKLVLMQKEIVRHFKVKLRFLTLCHINLDSAQQNAVVDFRKEL